MRWGWKATFPHSLACRKSKRVDILALYAAVGIVAGIIAGLFGVGGGLIIVPVLVFTFRLQEFPPEFLVHLAIGTSLATIILTSLSSTYSHHRHGAVRWDIVWRITPGILLGGLLGATLADQLSSRFLGWFFGMFELCVAAYLLLDKKPPPHRSLPGAWGLSGAGGLIGGLSALVGIGGGSMTVPYLLWCRVQAQQAVATAAACGLPIALSGTAGFVMMGWNEARLPAWSSGYLYWPALLGVALFSTLAAPFGAKLAHRLPGAQLKRYFAGLLILLGIKMLFFTN